MASLNDVVAKVEPDSTLAGLTDRELGAISCISSRVERQSANQIMGYATVAGVKWVVLTNGDEYRIYNSCVEVPIEEKLFRSIHVSDNSGSDAKETLALLSKDRIRDNEMQILWDAHFVDRQVRSALEGMFNSEPDSALARLLKRHLPDLSPKDVRQSLARRRVRFDFPAEPELAIRSVGKPKAQRRSAGVPPKANKRVFKGVSLKDLIDAGFLKAPLKLTVLYRKTEMEAELLANGSVRFQGKSYDSCSTAAGWARATITGREMNTNGWAFWQYRDETGNLRLLDVARQEFLKRHSK